MAHQNSKSMDPEQSEALRKTVRKIIERDFEVDGKKHGSIIAACRAFGLSNGALSDLLAGKRGGGMRMVSAVAKYANVSIDDILAGRISPELQSIPIEMDPYPSRVEIRKKLWYQNYPEQVRNVFESIRYKYCALNDMGHWLQWLEKINAQFELWVKEGRDPALFDILAEHPA